MGWEWPFGKKKKQQAEAVNEQYRGADEPQIQSHSFFKSYSSSKTCKKDLENDEYMICKEKIVDGNQTIQKEERIPIQQQMPYQHISKFNVNLKDAPQQMERLEDIDRIFHGFMNFPFFSGQSPFNTAFSQPSAFSFFSNQENQFNQSTSNPHFNQASSNKHQYQNKRSSQPKNSRNQSYFSFEREKDYDIKDI